MLTTPSRRRQVATSALCDGKYDCGMGEDEDAAACDIAGAADIFAWDTVFHATGASKACAARFAAFETTCGFGPAMASTVVCTVACAEEYVEWFMDCRATVFPYPGVAGPEPVHR
jgi:hypothetical protein